MSSSATTWRGSTMASRAAERREQLVRAGYALLGGEGAAATTMRAVCRAAGLSLRYFYENFADREALLIEIYDQTAQGLVDAVATRLSDAPVDETARARAAFDAAAQYFADDPRRGRIMFRETLADDTLRARGTDALPAFVTLVAAQLAPEQAARFTSAPGRVPLPVSAISGALVALFLDWLDGDVEANRDQVVDYATRLTISILELS
ncbi:TetR/AcrR family transcriptional regulator [Nocardia sp. NPDC051990]|uniref:TetR/AcrR family transcriptional regulator n=1 Tax=Nocardia sp. NPDC051990 TaxID=3155285 RepID=UPI00342020F8